MLFCDMFFTELKVEYEFFIVLSIIVYLYTSLASKLRLQMNKNPIFNEKTLQSA